MLSLLCYYCPDDLNQIIREYQLNPRKGHAIKKASSNCFKIFRVMKYKALGINIKGD